MLPVDVTIPETNCDGVPYCSGTVPILEVVYEIWRHMPSLVYQVPGMYQVCGMLKSITRCMSSLYNVSIKKTLSIARLRFIDDRCLVS